MLEGLKLLVEAPSYEIEYVIEEKNKDAPSNMYIHGPYLVAEKKNKNGRIYSLEEMSQEIGRYNTEMIGKKRSLGELNHPTSVEVNPERACHMITELKQDGNIFMGRSKILNTPTGHIVRNLIMDDVKLGVSSRALGKLEQENGQSTVSQFRFIAEDVVHDPSVDIAFIDGILEAKEYVIKCDGSLCELYDGFERKIETLPKHETSLYLEEVVINFIKSLKSS